MIRYTNEQKKFIINNNYMKTSKELADLFNKKFNTDILSKNIAYFRRNNHLKSGLIGRFEKGHIPKNKGKKWDEYMSKEQQEKAKTTCFKKGNIPQNHRPLGSERINKDGFIEVKVAEPNKWKTKNRIIWEQYYGKIPKGYKVIYLDGNKQNNNILNLKLISNAEELIMNQKQLRYNKKELTEAGHLIAQIIHKRSEIKNERL